jgi:hypothetical protein
VQAKEFVRQSPELKESFSSAATAAKTLAKEASCSSLGGGGRVGQDQVAIDSVSR